MFYIALTGVVVEVAGCVVAFRNTLNSNMISAVVPSKLMSFALQPVLFQSSSRKIPFSPIYRPPCSARNGDDILLDLISSLVAEGDSR